MVEKWSWVEGYTDCYKVSNTGRIKSVRRTKVCGRGGIQIVRERVLATTKTHRGKGYLLVALCFMGKVSYKTVHRLVAKAFVPNPERKIQVNHKDGDKLNNNADNLEWVSSTENMRHARQRGLIASVCGEANGASKLTEQTVAEIRLRLSHGEQQRKVARLFGVTESLVTLIKQRKIWKHI